jgi:hypothetical protein
LACGNSYWWSIAIQGIINVIPFVSAAMTERQPTGTFQPEQAAAHSTSHTTDATPTSAPPPPPDDAALPRVFGRYELRRLLGRGGMGRVYLAHDPQFDRLVALKMPNPIPGVAGWRERFLTEARAAATLTHPHVCPVYDVGEEGGQPYLTMAFIEGETLAAKLTRDGPFHPAAAVELVGTVARAMHEAHRRGIVHRERSTAGRRPASRPPAMRSRAVGRGADPVRTTKHDFADYAMEGYVPRLARPYTAEGVIVCANFLEVRTTKTQSVYELELAAPQLDADIVKQKEAGLRPAQITAYPHDEAVRYCVVWVKEPPKAKKKPGP